MPGRSHIASAAPLFFGDLDARLGSFFEDAALVLPSLPDDGLLAGVQDCTVQSRSGPVFHLV